MKRAVSLLAGGLLVAAAGAATGAVAESVAPGDVVYDYGAVAESLTGVPGDAEKGRKIASTKSMGNCITCHQVSALSKVQWHGEIGPSLDGVGSRWSEDELRGIVANAKKMFPGSMMPSFYKVDGFIRPGEGYTGKAAKPPIEPVLTAQQIEDVVAFLMTLKE